MASHLNICLQSIYVNDSGSWRLSGFEYVWKTSEVNKELLTKLASLRNMNSIDPSMKTIKKGVKIVGIEQYAFGTICEQLLATKRSKECTKQTIPFVDEFREYCQTHLKHPKPELRPQLSAVLLHPYFNHEFVSIHAFFFELPLKNTYERQDFFTGLIDRLRYFDEYVVAVQFGGDLLSRMVLLDATAQLCVTPYVLRTRNDHSPALFTANTYSKCILPHVLRMFRLRDAQIRLILLEYFTEFIHLLTKEQLQLQILPHLLDGMHDTNDFLVAKTLRSLADLIPILGSTSVLGNEQRTRLFSDGRPHAAISDTIKHWVEPRSITPVLGESGECQMVSGSPLPLMAMTTINATTSSSLSSSKSNSIISLNKYDSHNFIKPYTLSHDMIMQTRLSPDGGEDTTLNNRNITLENNNNGTTNGIQPVAKHEVNKEVICNDIADNNWLDWDTTEEKSSHRSKKLIGNQSPVEQQPLTKNEDQEQLDLKYFGNQTKNSLIKDHQIKIEDDLNKLDIQIKSTSLTNERKRKISDIGKVDDTVIVDYFKGMEPKIVMKTNNHSTEIDKVSETKTKLNIAINAEKFAANEDMHTESVINGEGRDWLMDEDELDVDTLMETIKPSANTETPTTKCQNGILE